LAVTDHDTEAEGCLKYFGILSNNNNDKTEEMKATIKDANKAYSLCKLPLDVNMSTEIIK